MNFALLYLKEVGISDPEKRKIKVLKNNF